VGVLHHLIAWTRRYWRRRNWRRVLLLAETAPFRLGRRVVDSVDHNRDMSWVLCVRPTRVLLLAETAPFRLGRRVVDSAAHMRDMS
jgi:hypothetical protein